MQARPEERTWKRWKKWKINTEMLKRKEGFPVIRETFFFIHFHCMDVVNKRKKNSFVDRKIKVIGYRFSRAEE